VVVEKCSMSDLEISLQSAHGPPSLSSSGLGSR
jgi:hypothetical protein